MEILSADATIWFSTSIHPGFMRRSHFGGLDLADDQLPHPKVQGRVLRSIGGNVGVGILLVMQEGGKPSGGEVLDSEGRVRELKMFMRGDEVFKPGSGINGEEIVSGAAEREFRLRTRIAFGTWTLCCTGGECVNKATFEVGLEFVDAVDLIFGCRPGFGPKTRLLDRCKLEFGFRFEEKLRFIVSRSNFDIEL